MRVLTAAVEGVADQAVALQLASMANFDLQGVYVTNGKNQLDKRLKGFNSAARFSPWLVLRDLDTDAPCPGELRADLLPSPSTYMCFRVVVRQIEAWIMADAERFAAFFRVRPAAMPDNPDLLPNAKQALLALIRHSKNTAIRLDMLPREGCGAREGPAYSSRLIEFVKSSWRPKVAAGRSPSLRRCLDALRAVPQPNA